MSSSWSIFSFFYKCTTDLDQAPVPIYSYKLGTGPIPLSSMYIDHTRHSTCTYTMMYKGQKQLSCNNFWNYFVSLSPHITLILATGTFLSAGRKSSQTTALYSSVCEYYVQIASPRVCVEFAAFQCRLAPPPPVLLLSGNNLTRERLSWARLKSPFVIIHAADLRLRGRHRSVFGFSAARQ